MCHSHDFFIHSFIINRGDKMIAERHASVFSTRLKELRETKELSQQKLAEVLSLSRSVVSNYEQGIREPDFKTIKLIANYFTVSTDFLLGVSDIKHSFLTQDEMQYYAGILKQIDDIKDISMAQIADMLNTFNSKGDVIKRVNALSSKSISDLKNYLNLLEIRDSAEN